jgi:hypothetical protein
VGENDNTTERRKKAGKKETDNRERRKEMDGGRKKNRERCKGRDSKKYIILLMCP